MLKIEDVLPYFKNSRVELADALGITKQAVSGWPDGVLPPLREKEIRYEVLPHVFGSTHTQRTNASQTMSPPKGCK